MLVSSRKLVLATGAVCRGDAGVGRTEDLSSGGFSHSGHPSSRARPGQRYRGKPRVRLTQPLGRASQKGELPGGGGLSGDWGGEGGLPGARSDMVGARWPEPACPLWGAELMNTRNGEGAGRDEPAGRSQRV